MHLYFNKISFIYKIVINNRISFSLSRIHIKITVKKEQNVNSFALNFIYSTPTINEYTGC